MPEILLEMQQISKWFPGVRALEDVSLDVRAGEVHALVGENGAGKSTLAKIVCGVIRPDGGNMRLRGQPYAPISRADAGRRGVGMVMQELNLIPTLSVAENLFLDRLPSTGGFIRYRQLREDSGRILGSLGLVDLDPDQPVGMLSVGRQQMTEIANLLSRQCDLLILDEPTAALTSREAELLFEQIARLRSSGVGILYISHRMEEIKRLADRITVLRDGRRVATHDAAELSIEQVIRLMVGRDLSQPERSRQARGAVAMRVEGLRRLPAVREVSFELHRGEILGLAGLMGSGRTETLRAIYGADARDGGQIYLFGAAEPADIRSPRDAVRLGVALLTEDRKEQGLLLPQSLRVNVTLANMSSVSRMRAWIRRSMERTTAAGLLCRLGVRCRSTEQEASQLSGGNQQKLIIARWICRDCDILLFDEPTRGIDVGAKFEIYELLRELAARGKAILVVSSDLPELMAISDRIGVMSNGRLVAFFESGQWTEDAIMAAALSGYVRRDAEAAGTNGQRSQSGAAPMRRCGQ